MIKIRKNERCVFVSTADRSDDLNSKVTSELTLKLVTEKFMARKEIGLTDLRDKNVHIGVRFSLAQTHMHTHACMHTA